MKTLSAIVLSTLILACGGADEADGEPREDSGTEDGDAGIPEGPPVDLPPDSREFEGVLNLVDAEATAQVEDMLRLLTPTHVALRQGATKPTNLFLSHYREQYDFLYFVLDHALDDARAVGAFEAVNRPAEPGGTSEIEIRAAGYRSNGRLKGVVALQYHDNWYPPVAHETVHYWANDLDPRFGFGESADGHYGPHWGFSSVHGQLGGFDEATLHCEDPAGASPADCVPLASGRTRYVVSHFWPHDNTSAHYAPLEQYLMGLVPAAEVPATFLMLDDATRIADSFDEASGTVIVEARGIRELAFADIVARHGEKALLPADQRAFRSAFVVVSATPASDDVLADVAHWSAIFGGREIAPSLDSFETLTDGRASMNTELGARRSQGETIPAERSLAKCDVLAQDCEGEGLACYLSGPGVCALSGGVAENETCDALFDCAPGLDCTAGPSNPEAYVCRPYCNIQDASAPEACDALCPGAFVTIADPDGKPVAGLCHAG